MCLPAAWQGVRITREVGWGCGRDSSNGGPPQPPGGTAHSQDCQAVGVATLGAPTVLIPSGAADSPGSVGLARTSSQQDLAGGIWNHPESSGLLWLPHWPLVLTPF